MAGLHAIRRWTLFDQFTLSPNRKKVEDLRRRDEVSMPTPVFRFHTGTPMFRPLPSDRDPPQAGGARRDSRVRDSQVHDRRARDVQCQ